MSIELPKDAEGRTISLSTKAIYEKDGNELDVRHFEFSPFSGKWSIAALKDGKTLAYRSPQNIYLKKPLPPDNWEKLLDDLDNASKGVDNAECCYTHREHIEIDEQCHGCRLYSPECAYLAYADIAARIRKLRGEGEDE